MVIIKNKKKLTEDLQAFERNRKNESWQSALVVLESGVLVPESRSMTGKRGSEKPTVFSVHARQRMKERGTRDEEVQEAIRMGEPEPAQRGLFIYRLNLEFKAEWAGKFYNVKQVAPVVSVEQDRNFVITVYTFYF